MSLVTRNATRVVALLPVVLAACAPAPSPDAPLRYLALGDSYTIGEGVATADRWPHQLAGLLRDQGLDLTDPEIIARTGWTTSELDAGIDTAAPEGPYDLVSLLIGVNNQFRGLDLDAYRAEFAGLLDRAIGFAGGDAGRVVVLSIPDWGVTPFAAGYDRARVAAEIDAFNTAARQITEAAGAIFLDITPISRRAATESDLLAGDGLHPSGVMYRDWAELVLPSARSILSR